MKKNTKRKILLLVLSLLLIIPGAIALLIMPFVILFGDLRWGWAALRSFDRWANVVLTRGSEFETISAHSWVARYNLCGCFVNWFLDLIETDHCQKAWLSERRLAKAGTDYLKMKETKYD